jgi:hypothetical protein
VPLVGAFAVRTLRGRLKGINMKKLLVLIALSAVLVVAVVAVQGRAAQACCPAPPNDDVNNAKVVTSVPYKDTESTVYASPAGNEPTTSCSSAGYGHSVWYQFTPAFSQSVNIDTFGSGYDTVLAVYSGNIATLAQVVCNDDASGQTRQSAVKAALVQGRVYHILVASFGSTTGGNLQFNITPQDEFFFNDSSLKCYQARIAKRSLRFQPQRIFTFDANFHLHTDTTIQGLSLYCNQSVAEPAGSSVAGGFHDSGDIKVTCYTARDDRVLVKGGNPIPGARVFAQNEFFGDQKLIVGRLESICVLAAKLSGQLPDFKNFEGQILRCYAARPVTGAPRPNPVRAFLPDQFDSGGKEATMLRPISYCTLGGKADQGTCVLVTSLCPGGEEPQPDEVAVVCYSLRQASFRPFNVPVIDQFIDQQFVDPQVTIRKADRYCVPSVKKPPFADNDDIPDATYVDVEQPPGPCPAAFQVCRFSDHVVTMNATRARNDPPLVHCASVTDHVDYGHSVWYTFTPANSEETHIDVDTGESSYDTVLVLYIGSPGSLTQLACNDDDGSLQTSDLEFDLQVGHKYFIMVGSKDRTPGGKLKFNLDACDVTCDE